MLKYFKNNDNYADGRTPIDTGLLEDILRESLRITSDMDVDKVNLRKTVLLFFACVSYYLYLHPEQYVDFGKFVAYRNVDIDNLLTVDVKDGESAKTIYDYFKNGGLEIEEIQEMVHTYTNDLLEYSKNKASELSDDINKINNFVSQDESNSNNKHKETQNGI